MLCGWVEDAIGDNLSLEDGGDLTESSHDERESIGNVVGQISNQLGEDGLDLVKHSSADEEQLSEDVGESEDDSAAERSDGVPDSGQTQQVEHVVDESGLLLGQTSSADTGGDTLDLRESGPDVGRGISGVVDEVSHQLGEDRGDGVPDSGTGEHQLSEDLDESSVELTSDGNNGIPQGGNAEAQVLLKHVHAHCGQGAEELALGLWLGHGESARSEAQSQKNSQHFFLVWFCFLFVSTSFDYFEVSMIFCVDLVLLIYTSF